MTTGKVLPDPVTMEGNFIKMQIDDRGALGNNTFSGLQIQFDKSGASSFSDTSVSPDYFAPGSPMEGFSVEVKPSGGSITEYKNTNSRHSEIGTGTLTDKSGIEFNGVTFDNRTIWSKSGTSGTSTPFDIEHDFMFNDSSPFVLIKTSITSLNDFETIYFGRYADPDSGQQRGLGYTMKNTVDAANAVTSVATDDLFAITLRTNTETSIGAGIGEAWLFSGKSYYEDDSTESEGDHSIGLGFKFDNVSSGDILSFYYAYCFGEDVTASRNVCSSSAFDSTASTSLNTVWVQPYAAMQNIGLKSIHNNRDLVLAKAGECNNSGWVIGDSDYCVYTNVKNKVSYVNGDTTRGSYGSAVFNGSINLEKTINDKWKAGIAYGQGTSNLHNFNFSGTTANLDSSNNHYSFYGVKKVNDKFTLKGMVGGSVFDYKGKRNYSSTAATAAYETDGYTAEINGTWDLKKNIKNMKTPIRLQPTVGVAYAAHTQDGFSESGSGDLITIDPNQAESLLFKTGISIDKQIPMEGGKWILVPSLALNYEMDPYSDDDHRSIKGGLTESSTAHTKVSSKTLGQHNGSIKVGADFICTKDFMFNLNAEYGLAEGGDKQSYGGGFRWHF